MDLATWRATPAPSAAWSRFTGDPCPATKRYSARRKVSPNAAIPDTRASKPARRLFGASEAMGRPFLKEIEVDETSRPF